MNKYVDSVPEPRMIEDFRMILLKVVPNHSTDLDDEGAQTQLFCYRLNGDLQIM